MKCIDLAKRFPTLRVAYEESYYADRGDNGRRADPWLRIIPCRAGHLFPWGGDYLAASTDRRGPTAKRLASLDCVELVHDADDGVTVKFHVDDFDRVAEVMRPKRKRQLSEEHKAKLAAASAAHRFKRDSDGSNRSENEPESLPAYGSVC